MDENIEKATHIGESGFENELRLLDSVEPEELNNTKISELELNKVCDLSDVGINNTDDENRKFVADNFVLLDTLSSRDYQNELPVKDRNFILERNIKECKDLLPSVYRVIDRVQRNQEVDMVDIDNCIIFYNIEMKKARWLEENYYPNLFDASVNGAISDIRRFLLMFANIRELGEFPNFNSEDVSMCDDLTWLSNKYDPATRGMYLGKKVNIRITPGVTTKWDVYHITLHELVHHASFQNNERVGIYSFESDPDFMEINEAVTELITFRIFSERMRSGDTFDRRLKDPSQLAYWEYIIPLKHLFSKIPEASFVDAVLNENGFDKLKIECENKLGRNGMINLGHAFKRLYNPDYKKNLGNIIPFPTQ